MGSDLGEFDAAQWPEAVAASYRADGIWHDESLDVILRRRAQEQPDRIAVVAAGSDVSYRELDTLADKLAGGLSDSGLKSGDSVVVQLPNTLEFIVLIFALFRLGVRPVLAMPAHRKVEIAHFATITQAAAIVVPDCFAGFDYRSLAREVLDEAPTVHTVIVVGDPAEFLSFGALYAERRFHPSARGSDIAVFLLSGGTTNIPKLIPRTHDDYFYNIRQSAEVCGFDSTVVYLAALPVSHNFTLACPGILGALYSGGTVVLALDPSPSSVFELIERAKVNVTAAVPSLVDMWVRARRSLGGDLSSLRLVQVGGARPSRELAVDVIEQLGCDLQQVFGMAEGLVCYTRTQDQHSDVISTQGRPMSPADEILVVDDQGAAVPHGEVGELLTRGPYTIRGYFRSPRHNHSAFTDDGFYRTGDLVRVTESGNIVVSGRIKEQINKGGEKISAPELEGHIATHPAVASTAVVSIPDSRLGEKICAFVVCDGDNSLATRSDLITYLRDRGIASFKYPDFVEFIESMPLTPVGKIDKNILRRMVGNDV